MSVNDPNANRGGVDGVSLSPAAGQLASSMRPARSANSVVLVCSAWSRIQVTACPSRAPLAAVAWAGKVTRSEEHTSELQSLTNLVCRLLLEKKNKHCTLHRTT